MVISVSIYRVKTARVEWVTAAYPKKSLPESLDGAIFFHSFDTIIGTSGMKSTAWRR